jgi:hypothetical protein
LFENPDGKACEVAMYLRADQYIAPEQAERLAELFRLAYENATNMPTGTAKIGSSKKV